MYGKPIIVLVTSLLVANATPLVARADEPVAIIYPDYTSQYNSATGAVVFHTAQGHVSRSSKNNGADISTLVTFEFDQKYADNQCQLVFDLFNSTSTLSGSKKAQLYASLAPAYADASSWPSGNLRDQALGSIDVIKGGRATWQAGSGPLAPVNGSFPCSEIAGGIYGGEVVPQGDEVEIKWPAGYDGVKVLVW
ncbi:uncharacterized protein PV07_08797 [Cladophialophora immunda]|uniref:Ubiquitin 3 binding protein But2 C-terminal domain-containing protein n=1 Tax=Cladophialophora immunda TaxID=569365 RepID=A0A0D1ZD05_9EURO|nr:uncharacterized protein PV07_08797 [Cladophialophora immunda]KIW25631.1 hypothetical protein PV07_08797 [Cladophialophora immunda]OQV10855.1 Ubiquitin 3 binding protein But2 domain-containing protein [Cladophialophora immunda]